MARGANKYLSDCVAVTPRFQRAIRISTDLNDSAAVKSYICPKSARDVLLTMANHVHKTGQGAFTWTGPYGGGKSSLALLLSAFLGNDRKLRQIAEKTLGKKAVEQLQPLRKGKGRNAGKTIVPVVGSRTDLETAITQALPGTRRKNQRGVIAALESYAKKHGGVVLILDEMGKFLEYAARNGGDVFLLQQIAEAASRSDGKLIVVGILHQSFGEYAARLGFEAQDEWAKVQGRFVDIPISIASDEQVTLIAEAIRSKTASSNATKTAKQIADRICVHKPSTASTLAGQLEACWPLHPVSAYLLGPIAKRRFGQNQRSVFGFLNSAEPGGFQDFLRNTKTSPLASYTPDKLWDYLCTNLEPAILASPDGHRWSIALEAVIRSASDSNPLCLHLVKCVALIDLFGKSAGLLPDKDVLAASAPSSNRRNVNAALKELCDKSILIFKRHMGAYALYAGSDFDIEEAVEQVQAANPTFDIDRLRRIARLQPFIAKRHYHDTGAMRWFELALAPVSALEHMATSYAPENGAMGTFVVAIPTANENKSKVNSLCSKASKIPQKAGMIVIGLPQNAWSIRELTHELLSLEEVRQDRPELGGDSVARREIEARISTVTGRLEEELKRSIGRATWWKEGKKVEVANLGELTTRSSEWADEIYNKSPIIINELLNRTRPSPGAVAARKVLMQKMVSNCGEPRLGIEGFPAEGGLFSGILERTRFYRKKTDKSGEYGFQIPRTNGQNDAAQIYSFLEAARNHIKKCPNKTVPLKEIYTLWEQRPYGIRAGLQPVFALAFVLAESHNLALYAENTFQPRMNNILIDKLLQGPDIFQVRWVDLSGETGEILQALGKTLGKFSSNNKHNSPIEVGREIVAIVQALPSWTLRTIHLGQTALKLRDTIKQANDPNQFLFDDIPVILGFDKKKKNRRDTTHIADATSKALKEIVEAYPKMLKKLRADMLKDLQANHKSGHNALAERARNVIGITGDFRLDAFATRLTTLDETNETMAGIASLAANKPSRDWIDRDFDHAAIEIASLVQQFKRAELFARVKGRPNKRHAIAFIIGRADGEDPLSKEFDITDLDQPLIDETTEKLQQALSKDLASDIALAAMAELGTRYITDNGKKSARRTQKRRSA